MAAAAVLGAAPLTKFSALYLYRYSAGRNRPRSDDRAEMPPPVRPRLLAIYGGSAVLFSLLFLNLGFEFRGTFTPLSGYRFDTAWFQRLQRFPCWPQSPCRYPSLF